MKNKSLNLKTRTLLKKAVSLITAVVMVITILPLQPMMAYAQETPEGYSYDAGSNTYTVSTFEGLTTALAAGGNIVLNNDITKDNPNAETPVPAGVTVVLDLNGKNITLADGSGTVYDVISVYGNLTVKDSATGGTIDASASGVARALYCEAGGILTIESGTYKASEYPSAIVIYGGNIDIKGGTFIGGSSLLVFNDADIDIYGGIFENDLTIYYGTVDIYGGVIGRLIIDSQGIDSVTIHGGQIDELYDNKAPLVIKGGTFGFNPSPYIDAQNYKVGNTDDGRWTVECLHESIKDDSVTPNNDGTHTFECSVCEKTVKAECSGGTANCTEKAVCTVCSTAYGQPNDHSFGTDDVCTACGLMGGYCGADTNEGGVESLLWTLSDGILTISGNGAMADYALSSNDAPWFSHRANITKVVVNNGVTTIGDDAFFNLNKIQEAVLPTGITDIGQGAFTYCTEMTKCQIPETVTSIGESAFIYCDALQQVNIPQGVTVIEADTFFSCDALENITIPAGITAISHDAFTYCTGLTAINVDAANTAYKSVDVVLFTKDGTTLVKYPEGKTATEYTIPSTVRTIGDLAFFAAKNLEKVIIPDSVTAIGKETFGNCASLTKITIPASVKEIGAIAFFDCTSLTEITFQSSDITVASNAFIFCNALTTVNVPCDWFEITYKFADTVTMNYVHDWTDGVCTSCGEICEQHTTFTYSSTENVITVACSVCKKAVGTATVTAEGGQYNGEKYAAEVSATGTLEDGTYTITYTGENYNSTTAPTATGTYTASVTVGGVTASVQFTISKVTLTADDFTFTPPVDLVYNGEEKQATVATDKTGMGEITVHYYDSDGEETSPVDAGTYTVKIDVTEGENYSAVNDLTANYWTFDIEKADPVCTAPQAIEGLAYTGQPQVLVTPGTSDHGTFFYHIIGDEDSPELPTGTEVRTYEISWYLKGDKNHSNITDKYLTVTISTADQTPLKITGIPDTVTYGDTFTLSAIGGDGQGGMHWAVSSGTYNATIDQQGNVTVIGTGDFTVSLIRYGDHHYNDASVSHTFTSQQKQLTGAVVSVDGGLVYNGAPHTPAVTVTLDGVTLKENTDYTLEYNNNINASAQATVTVKGMGNYTGTADKTFEIEKADVTADMFELTYPDNLIYNGNAKTVTAAVKDGFTGVGSILVKYCNENGDYVTEPVNAGKYTVKLSVSEGENYLATQEPIYPTDGSSWEFEITKATYDMSNVKWNRTTGEPFEFDGNTHTVELTGLPQGVTVSYAENSKTAVGTYIAKAELNYDSENYNTPDAIPSLEWYIEWNAAENKDYTINSAGTPNSDGWYNSQIHIIPADDCIFYTNNDASEEDLITLNEDTADGSVTFRVYDPETLSMSYGKTVTYKLDTTAPTGTVSVEENSWTAFLNSITFNKFFNKTVDVKVEAADITSGVKSVEYIESSTALTLDELKQIANWTDMGADNKASVTAEDAKQFVYYIRITDNADNVTYLSTDGATFDTQPPVIHGITEGAVYYTTQKFTAQDSNLENVTVNGNQSTTFALGGNVDREYVVVATDKAGNSTTVIVQMKPIASISETIKNLTEENVTADNAETIKIVEEALTAVDKTNTSPTEKDALAEAQENIDRLQQVIIDTAAEVKALEDKLAGYSKDTVKSTDETAVDQLIADLTDKLNDANLSEEQKSALTGAVAIAQDLAGKIDSGKQALEDANASVPNVDTDNVTADNAEGIAAAKDKLEDIVNDDNYTEEEKQAAQEQIDKIEELEKVIEETKSAVDDATSKPDYEAVTEDTVTSDDKQAVEDNIGEIDQLLNNQNVSAGQKEELLAAKDAAQDLLDKIAEDRAAKDNAIGAQQSVTDENVTADDAQNLADAKAILETMKDDDNYTATEKAEIQEEIDRITALEEVIKEIGTSVDKAVAEEGYASKTEADITSAEKDEIEANVETVEELLDTDNLTEEQRKALEDTKTEAEKLLAEIKENSEALDNALKAEEDTTEDNYQLFDKEDLKEAVENLKAVTDESNKNYTAEEKQTAQAEINRVGTIIADIEETETVSADITNAVEKVAAITDVKAIPDSEEAVDAVIAAQEDYNNLTDRQKELVGDTLKQNINDALVKITAYEIIKGDNSKYTKGSSKGLEFTANGLFKLFKEVRVNGNAITEGTDYTAVAGSTVITLSSDYLKSLSNGTYTLEVVYEVLSTKYIAGCEFTVKAKLVSNTEEKPVSNTEEKPISNTEATPPANNNVPKTGDNTNTIGWMTIMLSSIAALAVVLKKKKEYEDR